VIALASSLALAGTSSEAVIARPIAGHPVFELRVGVDRVDAQHPFLCAEGAPLAWLSFEACGTGSGLLHHDDDPDFAHFRGRARPWTASHGRGSVDWLVGAGFGEVQRTADAPGFRFGRPQVADPVEAAGPEASTALKGRYWVDPGARTYLTADLTVGVAAIVGAPEVLGRGGTAVPFTSLTVGLGF
jgi:hypothetical protein